jgi:hypothetical protein
MGARLKAQLSLSLAVGHTWGECQTKLPSGNLKFPPDLLYIITDNTSTRIRLNPLFSFRHRRHRRRYPPLCTNLFKSFLPTTASATLSNTSCLRPRSTTIHHEVFPICLLSFCHFGMFTCRRRCQQGGRRRSSTKRPVHWNGRSERSSQQPCLVGAAYARSSGEWLVVETTPECFENWGHVNFVGTNFI